MPVIKNAGTLKTGHGKAAPDAVSSRPALTGTGLVGAGPNIGEIDSVTPPLPGEVGVGAVQSHVEDPKSAHTAAAIEHDGHPDILYSSNVEGALDELIGTVMKRPPMLGEWSPDTTFSGIADWGYLKLRDSDLGNYQDGGGNPVLAYSDTTVQTAANVYPYLLVTTGPPRDAEFTLPMTDPRSDHQFNSGMDPFLSQPGMGYGRTHIGGYTRDGDAGPAPLPIFRSARLYPRPTGVDGATGRPARVPVTISGTLFPADRGVVALIHFANPGAVAVKTAFLAQPLISDETLPLSAQGRVVAALLLGNGILGDKCDGAAVCETAHICDGDPGGIFGVGTNSDGKHDPFSFPGRASGQYGLAEIHNGVNASAHDLQSPWDDLDGDTVTGTKRTVADVIPAPGQVRLGTDPDADSGAVVANGIPVLGGTVDFYGVPPTAQNGSLTLNIHGDAVVEDTNFFRYRLPVLKDYSPETGLKWTPRGEISTNTFETSRFFAQAATSNTSAYADGVAVGATWRTAGVYDSFDEDYWVWQIARYRQTFLMPSLELDGDREEVGTYMLVHFKQEKDFESFVRDGDFPWDSPAPYEVYGQSVVDSPEDIDNLANAWPAATDPLLGDGPAPLYGYAANPWHNVRNRIFMDPAGTALPAVASSSFTWTAAAAADDAVVWVSGVAYFTPRQSAAGAANFSISACDISLAAGFWTSYRTDGADLDTWPAGPGPAVVGSQNPVMVATAPWGYDIHPSIGAALSSLDVPVNTDPTLGFVPSVDYQQRYRLEVPFTHLGTNGSGVFLEANAPLDADTLALVLPSAMPLRGDDDSPSFSRNAVMRAHFRRPLNHIAPDSVNLPYALADGHGQLLTHTTPGTVLMHTTRFDKTNLVGDFGNYVVAGTGAPPNTSYVQLYTAAKDYTERFLDETHRYVADAPAALNGHGPYTAATITHLDGPGMGGWAGGPIETPVRIGLANTVWDESSWLLMEHHIVDATGGVAHDALQVAGLPDRNPRIGDVATVPFPSAGVLIYPATDFSTGHFPVTVTHMTAAQPDYSAAAGNRSYIRCFDTAFSNGATPVVVAGTATLVLRFDGVTLADIAYAAPGPGGLAASRPSISIKVPGLTTWMDVGRQDGAGPNKQDPLVDGGGCQVSGPETYDFIDPATGYRGCYVKCHVGPVATLFTNPAAASGYTAGSPADEAPVLIKVEMAVGAVSYNLEHIATGVGTFEGASKPGADPSAVRGIIGMSVVHPTDDTLISP